MTRAGVLFLHAAAFWPVWRWYAQRLQDKDDVACGLIALAAAVALTLRRGPLREAVPARRLVPAVALTALYAAVFPLAPPIVRAAVALAAVLFAARAFTAGPLFEAAPFMLLVLALPVIPHFDFFAGHPLRVAAAAGADALLSVLGWDAARSGACLAWQGRLVIVDAPCSGVRMLWTGLLLASLLAGLTRAGLLRTAALLAIAVAAVVAANAVRAAVLFFSEARIVAAPSWFHDAAGLASFAGIAAVVVLASRWLRESKRCAPSPSC